MFAVIIEDRTANTLLPLIRKHIAPGSIIISDKWKPYNNIKEMKDCLFEHHSVNHSKTFKDPETGACTNLIEGAWRAHLKSKISVQNYRKFQLGKYIHRRMWTKKRTLFMGFDLGSFGGHRLWPRHFKFTRIQRGELDRWRIAKAWGMDKTRIGAEKKAQWLFRICITLIN